MDAIYKLKAAIDAPPPSRDGFASSEMPRFDNRTLDVVFMLRLTAKIICGESVGELPQDILNMGKLLIAPETFQGSPAVLRRRSG